MRVDDAADWVSPGPLALRKSLIHHADCWRAPAVLLIEAASVQKRQARRERSLDDGQDARPLHEGLADDGSTPSGQAIRNEEGQALGLLEKRLWARDPERFHARPKGERNRLSVEHKESAKWLHSLEACSR